MRAIAVFLSAIFVLVAVSIDASAQEASGSDIDHLKAQVEKQQARIEAPESALAAQQQLLLKIASANSQKGILIPAAEPSGASVTRAIYEVETRENLGSSKHNNHSLKKPGRRKTNFSEAPKSLT